MSRRSARLADAEPGSSTSLLVAECMVALAEDDDDTARSKAKAAIEARVAPTDRSTKWGKNNEMMPIEKIVFARS